MKWGDRYQYSHIFWGYDHCDHPGKYAGRYLHSSVDRFAQMTSGRFHLFPKRGRVVIFPWWQRQIESPLWHHLDLSETGVTLNPRVNHHPSSQIIDIQRLCWCPIFKHSHFPVLMCWWVIFVRVWVLALPSCCDFCNQRWLVVCSLHYLNWRVKLHLNATGLFYSQDTHRPNHWTRNVSTSGGFQIQSEDLCMMIPIQPVQFMYLTRHLLHSNLAHWCRSS